MEAYIGKNMLGNQAKHSQKEGKSAFNLLSLVPDIFDKKLHHRTALEYHRMAV